MQLSARKWQAVDSLNHNSNIGKDKSFADDLNKERGIVSSRVALLLRSIEIKPLFYRFVLLNISPYSSLREGAY